MNACLTISTIGLPALIMFLFSSSNPATTSLTGAGNARAALDTRSINFTSCVSVSDVFFAASLNVSTNAVRETIDDAAMSSMVLRTASARTCNC